MYFLFLFADVEVPNQQAQKYPDSSDDDADYAAQSDDEYISGSDDDSGDDSIDWSRYDNEELTDDGDGAYLTAGFESTVKQSLI